VGACIKTHPADKSAASLGDTETNPRLGRYVLDIEFLLPTKALVFDLKQALVRK